MYNLNQNVRQGLLSILAESVVKGSEAELLMSAARLIQSESITGLYDIPDNIRSFLLRLIENFDIKGKQAPLILEIIVAISKEVEVKTESNSSDKCTRSDIQSEPETDEKTPPKEVQKEDKIKKSKK
jgi:hypothetical protein